MNGEVYELISKGEVTAQADRPGYDPISSTLWRQREEYCARMIQVLYQDTDKDKDKDPLEAEGGILCPHDSGILSTMIRVMQGHDLTKQKIMTKTKTDGIRDQDSHIQERGLY